MSDDVHLSLTTLQHLAIDAGDEGWRAYWAARGSSWRTQPEIDEQRQAYLSTQRAITPNSKKSEYPFKDVRLTRADVEWLLATHESGGMRGPVDWADERHALREGLDLRGANLSGADLAGLPLARLRGGLTEDEWRNAQAQQVEAAALHLEGADVSGAHLEGAILEGAHLEEARLRDAYLDRANLRFAHLEGASLANASLERAALLGAALDGAILNGAHLEFAELGNVSLAGAELFGAHLEGARLSNAQMAGKRMPHNALERVKRWRPDFPEMLPGANIGGMFCDSATVLDDAVLGDPIHGSVSVADLRWGGVNLAVVDWTPVKQLGDEREARQELPDGAGGQPKDQETRLSEFRTALRANRQMAVALRDQGLNEEADRFAYRAQVLHRDVLLIQALWRSEPELTAKAGASVTLWQRVQKLSAYVFSYFLDILAGYGYRPGRSFVAYVLSLLVFAVLYYVIGQHIHTPLTVIGALSLSINSFHGRGFLPSTVMPGDPVTVLTAVEAIVGLVIEISFIATFTQRFFGR
ncbi:MAG: pentapeptide repeat-containing protein [Ktedonobacterales bacterium]